jgi:Ca2+-binding RTX toxin-like protein
MVEPLERRFLMAYVLGQGSTPMVDVQVNRGILNIAGSGLNDSVHVSEIGSNLVVKYTAAASFSSVTSPPVYSYQTKIFASGSVSRVVASLKGGHDLLHWEAGPKDALVTGGGGNDRIRGRFGSAALDKIARILGEAGADTFEVSGGAFVHADGGAGSDTFRSYNAIEFGPMVDYSARSANVIASMNGAGGDGEAGENDHIEKSCFGVIGGSGNDYLAGSLASAGTITNGEGAFYGNDGNDTIFGGVGYDAIFGGKGNDQLHSGSGPGSGPDIGGLILGGDGNDTLWGTGGGESLNGDAGDDVLIPIE